MPELDVQHEYAAIETHPGEMPPPKPPIGSWMAQNLERNGVTCKYGTVHMAYILDRHASHFQTKLGSCLINYMPSELTELQEMDEEYALSNYFGFSKDCTSIANLLDSHQQQCNAAGTSVLKPSHHLLVEALLLREQVGCYRFNILAV